MSNTIEIQRLSTTIRNRTIQAFTTLIATLAILTIGATTANAAAQSSPTAASNIVDIAAPKAQACIRKHDLCILDLYLHQLRVPHSTNLFEIRGGFNLKVTKEPRSITMTVNLQWFNQNHQPLPKWESDASKPVVITKADLPKVGHEKAIRVGPAICLKTSWRIKISWKGVTDTGKSQKGTVYFPGRLGEHFRCGSS